MNVCGNVGNLIGGKGEFRHSPIAAIQQDGTDRFPFLIIEDQLRSKQVGPVVTTARIGAMTKAAVHLEQHFSACDCRGIRNRPLGIRDKTSTSLCAAGRLRILCGRGHHENEGGNHRRQPAESVHETASSPHRFDLHRYWSPLGRAMSW